MGPQDKNSLLLIAMIIMMLGLSIVHELQAVPISRTLDLADEDKAMFISQNNNQMVQEESNWEQEADAQFFHGRIDIQSNDYPGSGANNRHDPGSGSRTPGKSIP